MARDEHQSHQQACPACSKDAFASSCPRCNGTRVVEKLGDARDTEERMFDQQYP